MAPGLQSHAAEVFVVLPIFPENGLANSVTPPVLIGLTFSTFFAETLGWNFSGLIVPGYLAPIFIVRPMSGLVIIFEALIAYIVLRILSDGFSRYRIWTRFFGQDAFFALFCISILVKCLVEGPFQPALGAFAGRFFPGVMDYRNALHSTGLIAVPLMANIFWRHGLRRNILPTFTVMGLTYLFVRHILLPYTNFSVNQFELLYSKMAINFVESPRYYFILLMGVTLASHNKYRYGWAYHGMLIPALLGIAWLTPVKILTTFFEAGVVLFAGRILVQSRLMKNMTVEGPRKLLLLFSISFALKMLIGFTAAGLYPGFQASDLYGFAYILPALLAMEMWPGRYFVKVARVTIQTAFIAALTGLIACFAFQQVLPTETENVHDIPGNITSTHAKRKSTKAVKSVKMELLPWLNQVVENNLEYGCRHRPYKLRELSGIDSDILKPLMKKLSRKKFFEPHRVMIKALRKYKLKLVRLTDPGTKETFYILMETDPKRYSGIYLFRLGKAAPLVLEVPQPLTEFCTLEMAEMLFRDLHARGLYISGTSRRRDVSEFDVTHLEYRRSLFQLAHQAILRSASDQKPVLCVQIRGATDFASAAFDAVLSTGKEIRADDSGSPGVDRFKKWLESRGLRVRYYRGDPADINFSTRSNAQQAYVESFHFGEFAVLWTPARLRESYGCCKLPDETADSLHWDRTAGSLPDWLKNSTAESTGENLNPGRITDICSFTAKELETYRITGNVVHLKRLTDFANRHGLRVIDFSDTRNPGRYLCLQPVDTPGSPVFVFNFQPAFPKKMLRLNCADSDFQTKMETFRLSGIGCLVVSGGQR